MSGKRKSMFSKTTDAGDIEGLDITGLKRANKRSATIDGDITALDLALSESDEELEINNSNDDLFLDSSSEEDTLLSTEGEGSAYASFDIGMESDSDSGGSDDEIKQDFTKDFNDNAKKDKDREKKIAASRILQGLPETQLLQVMEELQTNFGPNFMPYLSNSIEKLKNNLGSRLVTEEDERWDWNQRFQNAILKSQAKQRDTISEEDKMILWSFLSKTAGDFVQIATVYGKIIISEVYTPINEKTIKPMNMGGTIGGDKFLVKKGKFNCKTFNFQ